MNQTKQKEIIKVEIQSNQIILKQSNYQKPDLPSQIKVPIQKFLSRNNKIHRRKSFTKYKISKTQFYEIFLKIYLKRIRYPMQLFKQYILFNQSDTSLNEGYKYVNQIIDEAADILNNIINLQQQKRKIMGFVNLKLLLVHNRQNDKVNKKQQKKQQQNQRKPENIRQQKKIQKKVRYNLKSAFQLLNFIQKFINIRLKSVFHKIKNLRYINKLQKPNKQINTNQTTAISQNIPTSIKKKHTLQNEAQNQYQNFDKKQQIFLINRFPLSQNEKKLYIKIPIQGNNVQINQINLFQIKKKQTKIQKLVNHKKEQRFIREFKEKKQWNSCKYCQQFCTFHQLRSTQRKYKFSNRKYQNHYC